MVFYNLKALIKAIRSTKTIADERALIVKESAVIRTSFKEEGESLNLRFLGGADTEQHHVVIATPLQQRNIRSHLPAKHSFTRHHNVAKLLYIHMLGYPAHFGQIECLKLVASPRYVLLTSDVTRRALCREAEPLPTFIRCSFSDKRLGYLGIMLLLDENQEVLTLVTNSLKNDMNHSNTSTVSIALCTFANIASEEMSRDLVTEIERCLGSGNAYIRKKAALAALRCIYKVPDLVDHFEGRSTSLLSDRNHGVLLTGVTLVTEMCRLVGGDPFRQVSSHRGSRDLGPRLTHSSLSQAVPLLVRHLKALVTTGYSPEHDVSGITDPFLQVKILRLLRMLGKDDVEASEAMNDILAQVATNTESAKNVGNSILYETVLTILEIEAESGLRVMAINILGKFLSNRDNNIRYVALNTLNKVVAMDTNAVQRHRSIILDCLRDGDISIRRRALELSYALINEQNVRVLIRELLAFLEVADNEFKLGMTTQVCAAAEKFAPNRRWHIDTVLRVLKLAGNFVREEVLSGFIRLITHTPDLQSYTVYKLYTSLRADVSQESLTLAGVWTIGEFGDILLQGGTTPAGGDDEESAGSTTSEAVSEKDVLDLMENVLISPYTNNTIRAFVLTALTKLSTRFEGAAQLARISKALHSFDSSVELELQQRAIEFGALLSMDSIKTGVLERMPPPELRPTVMGTVSEKRPVGSLRRDKDVRGLAHQTQYALLDIDLMGEDSGASAAKVSAPAARTQTTQDLLADIFGSSNDELAPAAAVPASSVNDVMSLFGSTSISSQSATSSSQSAFGNDLLGLSGGAPAGAAATRPSPVAAAPTPLGALVAYAGNGLRITLTPMRDNSNKLVVNILAKFTATQPISNVNFQAAVPKTQKLQMLAMSKTDVGPGSTETQQLRVMVAAPGALVRLRLRVGYVVGGEQKQEQTDFSFPAGLMA
ncbi:BZ3500_MvSof-1268-A1-R1_Chr4-3g07292 [Microbotryum saponariae]|uniref:AP-1 complex subunit gamma n=1 Tax=Microbotryum saponariae TaxID=289078 RepID=A0A2X0MCJ8_9BASI|nr:BZ3500_MvSof-1268-A1-R1_Chr4-3g07292 [Microbotryum saponariae]SDA06955.1 BZ3501_MvSof-1269-A2-R1_Chr4-2g07001 [Microbotryum saponariae]